jgi:hypothetical protein
VVYFGGFFAKLGHFAGFSLHIINFVAVLFSRVHRSPREYYTSADFSKTGIYLYNINFCRKEQRSCDGEGGGPGGGEYLGCTVAQLGSSIAQSVGCSVAQKGAA